MTASSVREIEQAADIIRASQYAIALTGAGFSMPSGIPDFRSPESGLWNTYNPSEVASLESFRQDPKRFYDWLRPLIEVMQKAEPNPAHHAFTQLQKSGYLHEIITQNIDGLHEAAKSDYVLPLHGHTLTATCPDCYARSETPPIWEKVLAGQIPECKYCYGVYKPDVVLFGEHLPSELVREARKKAQNSDVMIIAGSSLEVYPVASLPRYILENKGSLLIINKGPTSYDSHATLKIEDDVATVLPQIVQRLTSTHP